MTSKASISGHPVHPMLVSFPIGLWITSFAADVIFYFHRNTSLLLISKFMIAAGIVGAIAAAVPGIVDWLTLTDKDETKVANWHARLNIIALIIFAISLYFRMRAGSHWVHYSMRIPFLLSFLGVVLISISGWLGGELTFKHGVGRASSSRKDEPKS